MGKDKKKSDMDDDDDLFGILKDDTDMRDTRAKRIYKQHYRKAWEKETDFKGWLTSVPDQPNRAYCKACRTTLHAHRLTLVKHTISVKHMKASVAYYEAASYQTKQMDKSCEMIELQVDTNINSEDEGGMVLVGDALQTKKSDNSNALKKDGSQLGERHTTDDSALSEIQSSPELNSDNNEDRLRDELADDPADSKVITSNTSKETGRSLVLARPDKPPISTHVLDTTRGLPVSGIRVILYQLINGRWTHLNDSCTNPDGRCADLIDRESVKPGRYKMHFETHQYFELRGLDCLFPFVEVVFDVRSPAEYLHIPVLMTPYSYSVYRGS